MINRAAIILKYKDPAVKWINEADPYNDDPGITKESVNEDRTVYLIEDDNADSPSDIEKWIKTNLEKLFENELESWYTDENLWPGNRTYQLFQEWFEVECYTVIEDTVEGPIIDEDI